MMMMMMTYLRRSLSLSLSLNLSGENSRSFFLYLSCACAPHASLCYIYNKYNSRLCDTSKIIVDYYRRRLRRLRVCMYVRVCVYVLSLSLSLSRVVPRSSHWATVAHSLFALFPRFFFSPSALFLYAHTLSLSPISSLFVSVPSFVARSLSLSALLCRLSLSPGPRASTNRAKAASPSQKLSRYHHHHHHFTLSLSLSRFFFSLPEFSLLSILARRAFLLQNLSGRYP